MTHLNPVFDVEGGKFVMSTPEIAGVRMQDIGEKVGSLDHRRTEIIAALDYLFTGI
jgi:toxin CcdB